jgi:hypothetical protein
MRVQFNDAAMLDLSGLPMLVQQGQVVNVESELGRELVRAGLATAVAETTDAVSERSHACTPFQQLGAQKRPRQQRSQ